MRIWRLNALVVVLSRLENFKAKLLIKLDGVLVVDLNVKEDTVKVAVLGGDVVEHVFDHFSADSQTPVRSQTA